MAKNKCAFLKRIFYLKTVLSKNRIKPEIKKKKAISWSPIANSSNLISTNFESKPTPKLNTIKSIAETERYQFHTFFIGYLKKLSTNSYLLKTCKSSIPSPTPMYFTGIWN